MNITEFLLIERANRFLDKHINNKVLLTSYFNDQGIEDFHVNDNPKLIVFTYEGNEYGHELFIDFENCAFNFLERDYHILIDETNRYISLGSKKHDDHYIIIEFQDEVI